MAIARTRAPAATHPRAPSAEDVLTFVERAYDVEASDQEWVSGLAAAALPLVDSGGGVHAFRFDLSAALSGEATLAGGTEAWQRDWRAVWWDGFIRKLPGPTLRMMIEFGPVSHTSGLWAAVAQRIPTFEQLLAAGGGRAALRSSGAATAGMPYPDSLNLVGADPSGIGIALCANRVEVESRAPSVRARAIFGRLTGHMTAAARLRVRVGRSALLNAADAVLDAKGTLLHAEPEVKAKLTREALRAAARDVTRARTKRGHDADAILQMWRALYAGEFSVVDVFDTDGRRFVVAKSNLPSPAGERDARFSLRERQILALVAAGCSNKLIGYQLGLAPSTVASHVQRLVRTLGAHGPADFVERARQIEAALR